MIFELINRNLDMRHYEGNFCATLQKENVLFGFYKSHPKEYIILKGTFDFSLPHPKSTDSSDSGISSNGSSDLTMDNESQADVSDFVPIIDSEAPDYGENAA